MKQAPTPIIRTRGLTVRYGGLVALESVDVSFAPGELVAVVGRNGARKSSLLRALAGVAAHNGDVVRDAARVAYVAQRSTARWDLPLSVRQVVATARLRPGRWWRRGTARDRGVVDEALERFDLGDLRDYGCDKTVHRSLRNTAESGNPSPVQPPSLSRSPYVRGPYPLTFIGLESTSAFIYFLIKVGASKR